MKNKYEVEGNDTKVFSTGKNKHLFFYIDTRNFWLLNFFSWRIYITDSGYHRVEAKIMANGKTKTFTLARWLLHFPEGKHVDHIDRDPLNNRMSNLRIATREENCQNASKYKAKTSSIYKGVCFHKQKQKWMAYINVNKKRHGLGYFNNEIDAAIAYNNKIKELGASFCTPNVFVKSS